MRIIINIFIIFCLLLFSACPTSGDIYWGLYKISIKNGWNLISIPMQTLELSSGKITSKAANTITDSTKNWTIDDYKNDILLIATGSGQGYYYKISSNTSNTLTLSQSLSSSISTDDYFYIYKSLTLTELFGDHTGPLYAADNINDADRIYLWDKSTQAFSESIWLCNSPGNEGWWQGSTKITTNSITLIPNEACFVVRKPSSTATINYIGIVPNTKQTLNIKSGDNIWGESFPTSVTMSNSGLSSIVKTGTSSYTADNIYPWNYDGQRFDLPIWLCDYPGYGNWYKGSENANSINLGPAEGYMFKNRDVEKNWQRDKPYSNP